MSAIMRSSTFFLLIYYFVVVTVTSKDLLKNVEYEEYFTKEKGEIVEMYKDYFEESQEETENENSLKFSIKSFNWNCKYFLEIVTGKNVKIEGNEGNEEPTKAIFVKLMNENEKDKKTKKAEDESKKIENEENYGWNEEFGLVFKEFHENALNLLEELFKNENWSLEKKFCKLYILIYYWMREEKLLKNVYWNEYIKNFKLLPNNEKNIFANESLCEDDEKNKEKIEKLFENKSFQVTVHNSLLEYLMGELQIFIFGTKGTKIKVINLMGKENYEISKNTFLKLMRKQLQGSVWKASVRWQNYEKIFKFDEPEEKMHDTHQYKHITKDEILMNIGMFSNRIDKVEENLNSKELDELFIRIKSILYENFGGSNLLYIVQLLFNLAKLFKDKENIYKSLVREGKSEKIIEEVDEEISNVKIDEIKEKVTTDEENVKEETVYSLEPLFEMRRFLGEEHMKFLKTKFEDKNILNKFKKKDGSLYCLYMLLDGYPNLVRMLDEYGLIEIDDLQKDEKIIKHYIFFLTSKNEINQKVNRIIVDYLVCLRWAYSTIKDYKQKEKRRIMLRVFMEHKFYLKFFYEKLLWCDVDNFKNIDINIAYKLYKLKLFIEEKRDDKTKINKPPTELHSEWHKKFTDILRENLTEKNDEINDTFDTWAKEEHYRTIDKLIEDKNNKLLLFLIEEIIENEENTVNEKLKIFVNENNSNKLMKKLTEDAKQQIKVKNVKKKKEKIDKKQIKAIKIAESKPAVDKEVEKKVITEEKEAIEKETKVEIIKNVEESIKLDYFIDDKNMFSIFNEFTKGKHSITQRLINVGIYVNEIGERFEFLEKLKKHVDVFEIYFVNLEKFKRMENYWGKIKEELIFKNKHEENKKIENKLNYLLIEILKLSEGKTIFGRYNKEEISEKMKENLYLEKISKYFVDKDETISSLSKNQRQFVQNLLNLKKDVIDDKILKIQKRIGELKKIKEQIKLDNVTEDYPNPMGFQQLSHFGNLETTEIEKLNEKNLLNKFLIIKSPEETFKIILNKWFIEQKKDGIENLELIMSSPYLKVEGGNIQAIVVYSGEKNERTKSLFRGDVKNTICKDEDHTLFCHLCRESELLINYSYHSSPTFHDDRIFYEIQGTEFEISFIIKNTSRNWINQMMIKTSKNLTKGNDEERQENVYKLYNLSLFKTYEYLENLFKESKENHMVVSNAFITLKSWAKAYSVYNKQFGFLDGVSISLMLTKVFLLYPGNNLAELLQRFFLTYATRNWTFPLRIAKQQILTKDDHASMTIYTPTNPEILILTKVTESKQMIIRGALLRGLQHLLTSLKKQKRKEPFFKNTVLFEKMYKHFVVFSCITKEEVNQANSCGFLENYGKINDQIESLENIEIFHVGMKTDDCGKEILKQNIYFCTSWLAGIKLKDGFFGNKNYKLSKEEKKKHCDEIMKILKIDIEIRVKMPGVTEDLKIHIITQGDIENWGFDVKHHDLD